MNEANIEQISCRLVCYLSESLSIQLPDAKKHDKQTQVTPLSVNASLIKVDEEKEYQSNLQSFTKKQKKKKIGKKDTL